MVAVGPLGLSISMIGLFEATGPGACKTVPQFASIGSHLRAVLGPHNLVLSDQPRLISWVLHITNPAVVGVTRAPDIAPGICT